MKSDTKIQTIKHYDRHVPHHNPHVSAKQSTKRRKLSCVIGLDLLLDIEYTFICKGKMMKPFSFHH